MMFDEKWFRNTADEMKRYSNDVDAAIARSNEICESERERAAMQGEMLRALRAFGPC